MRRGMDKALVAFACAILIGALGALSWRSDQEIGLPGGFSPQCNREARPRDEVIYEIEKLNSFWRSYDTGTGRGKGAAGNP